MTPSLFLYTRDYDYSFFGKIEKELDSVGFEEIGDGCSRRGYRRGNVVVKIPTNYWGIRHNIAEAYGYRKFRNEPDGYGRVYAPSRMLPSGCLMMVFVDEDAVPINELPYWVQTMDGYQAGKYKGRIVAYDMSHNSTDDVRDESPTWDQKQPRHDFFHSDVQQEPCT